MIGHLQRFLAELQRRKVLRIAAGYVVGAWIVLQVALALQTAMSLSGQFSAAILALLVIGFFVTIVLAWFYEITPEGVKRTAPATGDTPLVKPQTTDLALAGALTLVVVVALVQLLTPSPTAPPATTPTTTVEATPAKPEPPTLGDKSIAVLPFANLSPDKEDEYFADGLTEEILNLLAQLRGVKVISRTSSFAFKGKNTPLPEIAKQLGVRHILEGSVRRNGDDLRITAQLIDVSTDSHLWSETFDRKLSDIFGVQDDVARAIAGALNVELLVPALAGNPPTKNMEAYRYFLGSVHEFGKFTRASFLASIDHANQAIELDPHFAEAYGSLAISYDFLRTFDRTHAREYAAKSREAAKTAAKLKPTSVWANQASTYVALADFDWETAVRCADRLGEGGATHVAALLARAHTRMAIGKSESAMRTFEEAALLDPLSPVQPVLLSLAALARGDNVKVVELATRLLSRKGANFELALVAQEAGKRDAAETHFRAVMRAYPQNSSIIEPVAHAIGDGAEWRKGAVKALRDESTRDPEFDLEHVYLLVDTDAFLDAATKRLLSKRDSAVATQYLLSLIWHLVARGEGANPKLKALFQKIGLVDYWKKHGWPDRCRPKGEDDFECS